MENINEDGTRILEEYMQTSLLIFKIVKEATHVTPSSNTTALHTLLFSERQRYLEKYQELLEFTKLTLDAGCQDSPSVQVDQQELKERKKMLQESIYESNEKIRILIESLQELQSNINLMMNTVHNT